MVEPGPVWHVSVAPRSPLYGAALCEQRAKAELAELGNAALGEWREWTGVAFDIRRRLTAAEQERVGPVLDIRRTPEARRRALRLGNHLSRAPEWLLEDEIGEAA